MTTVLLSICFSPEPVSKRPLLPKVKEGDPAMAGLTADILNISGIKI
jgi:hypothetical protein